MWPNFAQLVAVYRYLPYYLGLGLIDDHMLWGRRRLADRRRARRRVPPVDPPLARGKELPTPRAVLHQRPLILRKNPLDVQQHLLLGTVAEGVRDKDDLTAAARELLQQHHVIGIAPRQPIRAPD